MIISQAITEQNFCRILLQHFQIIHKRPEITEIKIDYIRNSSLKIEKNIITLNKKIYENINPSGALIVFLHDLYHEYKQNIKGYSQVLIMKKFYGDVSLILIDVDVDLRLFKYFKLTFENYLKIFFEEHNTIFADVGDQYKNLVRLISSLLSIYIYAKTGKTLIAHITYDLENMENMYMLVLENMEFRFIEYKSPDIPKIIVDFHNLSTTRKNYQTIYPHLEKLFKLYQET